VATLASGDKRVLSRLRPRGVVSLAIYQGEKIPPAYAILSDISEGGVRIHSDRILAKGQQLQLRIQFESEKELFETKGRVAWTRPAKGDDSLLGGSLSGIALELPSRESAYWLKRLLTEPEFERPDGASRDYEDFVSALRPYLERVGDYLVALGLRRR
jgi:Tfp pilus assembly protein PilZ